MSKVTIKRMREVLKQYEEPIDQRKALGIRETTWWRYRKQFSKELHISPNTESTKDKNELTAI